MTLVESFDELFWRFRPYFKRIETFERARAFGFSHAVTYGSHTVSRMICSKNEQFKDRSADYKFFSKQDWRSSDFSFERRKQVDALPNGENRLLFLSVDGGFCNKSFLQGFPKHIIYIARTRKDIKIFMISVNRDCI